MLWRCSRAVESALRDTEAKVLWCTSWRLAAETEKVARGFIAIEAAGRTTPAIATRYGERAEREGWVWGEVVVCGCGMCLATKEALAVSLEHSLREKVALAQAAQCSDV